MDANIFFDLSKLKKCGHNVIVGKTVRIRYPELVELGDNVIIDDFTYISTSLKMGSFTHISPNCSIIGGRDSLVQFGEFSTLAPGVVLAAGSDDYRKGIASISVPPEFRGNIVHGRIEIGKHCIVGSNSTVLPNVVMGEGSALGAQSLANKNLDPWTLYVGTPAKIIGKRDKEFTLDMELRFQISLK